MKNSLLRALLLAVLVATPASAHHSLAAFETSSYRTVEGTVKGFFWGNPHSFLTLAVEEPSGESTDWIFEGGSPGRLARGGFDDHTIVPGDKIIVSYHRNRDNSIGGFFLAVTKENGERFSLPRFQGLSKE